MSCSRILGHGQGNPTVPYRNFDIARMERQIANARRYEELARKNATLTPAQERALKQATEAHRRQLAQLGRLPAVDQNLVRSVLAPAQEAIKRNLRNLSAALKPRFSLPSSLPRIPLIPKLPDLSQMVDLQGLLQKAAEAATRAAEAAAEGDDTLEASGFGFADHLWNWGFVASFAHIDPRVRDAVVTNRLAAETRSEEFERWLEEEMTGSEVLAHRWEAVRQALAAHRRREYLLSIPVLLAQVEGIVGDALVLKNRATADGHKLYRLGADGAVDLNKKEKPVELRGVSQLLDHSDFGEQTALEEAVAFLTNSLIPWRNGIMHGRNASYGKAKLSVQALLMVLLLSAEVRAFEEGRPPSAPAPYGMLPRPAGPERLGRSARRNA